MIQSYLIIVVLAICMPMYNQVKGVGFQTFLFLLAVTLIMKYWNIMLHWNMLKMKGKGHVWAGKIIRYFMNATLLYFIINEASLYFTVSVLLIMLAFTYYVIGIAKDQPIKWETLIHQEEARMQIFYRAANLVTDVPQLKGRVKRRKWLDPLVSAIPFGKQQTYHFLYRRTLIRTSEYSGLIIRLTLIAAILIFFSKHLYVSLGLAVLFMYLTGFQLLPLLRHHQVKVWPSLYPLQNPLKKQSFLQLLLKLLLFQAILFGMMVLVQGKLIQSVAVIVVGILFAFLFANVYAPKRIAKMK